MTTFPDVINHEGVQTTKGRRYLLIGFLAVDPMEPWTRKSTGLSWFSSWLSINCLATKFHDGSKVAWKIHDESLPVNSWMTSFEAGKFFQSAYDAMIRLGDMLYEHRFSILVDESSSEEFLRALDAEYEKSRKQATKQDRQANWFRGQQVRVGVDGGVVSF